MYSSNELRKSILVFTNSVLFAPEADLGTCVTRHDDDSAVLGYCWCHGHLNRFKCGDMSTCI
jgi:hypothetical protein